MADRVFYPVFLTLLILGGGLMLIAYDQMKKREAGYLGGAPTAEAAAFFALSS